jgi:hypothetical protein
MESDRGIEFAFFEMRFVKIRSGQLAASLDNAIRQVLKHSQLIVVAVVPAEH